MQVEEPTAVSEDSHEAPQEHVQEVSSIGTEICSLPEFFFLPNPVWILLYMTLTGTPTVSRTTIPRRDIS
jgi:hypothetical protein